ncbi:cytoskeleton-associated protein 2-like [Micropterus dolomieu]|uniref:cytoskeleton-associated protein 2-like n=1 Tax=Micropterus dolomieu TaxID=147949 RepID=UPI001E8D7D32|nr:cytoskeleton-associated protein 2-like [Micropterus dolomieu]
MEEGETVSILSRKELRKQKLMEYLAAKGKMKLPNPKSYLRNDCQVKAVTPALKVTGKENKTRTAQSKKLLEAQPKLNQKPVFKRTYTVASSISNLNSASHLKKQPNTGIQASGRASSNAACTARTKSNSRFSSSSNATWSCPMKTVSVRISLGPIVKTKTGLIPAVTQPRNGQSQSLTHTSAPAADTTTTTSVANKVRPITSSSVSLSQRSAVAQRKTLPTTALDNPVNKRTTVSLTARAGIKVQDQNKYNSNPLLGKHSQPSSKSQSSGLKSTFSSSKCTAAPIKPVGRVGMSKTNKPAGQPTERSTKQRSEGERKGQPCTVASRASSGPVSRCSSRAVSRVMRTAVAELAGKTKTCKETDAKKGHSSTNAPPPKTGMKRTGAPVMSQTAPQPIRTISHTGQSTDMKTPKVPVRVIPQTERVKLTAAQEERMRKLQEWREAKGISYKRPPMPVKTQVRRTVAVRQPFWAAMKEEDEAHSLISAVDRSLADCIKLLGEGCPSDQVKEVLSRLPAVSQKFAKYWICQARLMEQEGNLDVLPMFEEAVGVVLEVRHSCCSNLRYLFTQELCTVPKGTMWNILVNIQTLRLHYVLLTKMHRVYPVVGE